MNSILNWLRVKKNEVGGGWRKALHLERPLDLLVRHPAPPEELSARLCLQKGVQVEHILAEALLQAILDRLNETRLRVGAGQACLQDIQIDYNVSHFSLLLLCFLLKILYLLRRCRKEIICIMKIGILDKVDGIHTPWQFSFELKTQTRNYLFLCPTEEERDLWINGLNRILQIPVLGNSFTLMGKLTKA